MQRLLACIALIAAAPLVSADIFRPAYLEIRELGGDEYALTWKVPSLGGERRLAAYLKLPDGAETLDIARIVATSSHWTESSRIRFPGGLAGQTIDIEGRAAGVTEIVARMQWLNGISQVERLPMERPQFRVATPQGTRTVAWTYLVLGIEHILGGIDHLLFVFALLLIVRGARRIFATVTAFTAAHSLTLAGATLGWVHVPGPPVEAVIALSIVFVAREVVQARRGYRGLTERAPWIVAFAFGLLHGFGFAGALAEVGLPQIAIPVALLTFNVGVEIGQLLFVVLVLLLFAAFGQFIRLQTDRLSVAASYAIGSVAAFWTIERIAAFWA